MAPGEADILSHQPPWILGQSNTFSRCGWWHWCCLFGLRQGVW